MADKKLLSSAVLDRASVLTKISSIGAATTTTNRVTRSDLAFIDAAIKLHEASQAPAAGGPGIAVGNPASCDVVDVVAAVVAVAVLAYHAYNSCLIGGDSAIVNLASRLNIAPNVSLDNLVQARNQLASALGAEAM